MPRDCSFKNPPSSRPDLGAPPTEAMYGDAETNEMLSFCHLAKLEAFCSSPLSFELRSVVCLPQSLCSKPDHQHDTEPCDRTDQSEHEAIVCMFGKRIHVLFLVAPNLAQRLDQTTNSELPTEQSLSRFSSFTFLSSANGYRNGALVLPISTRDPICRNEGRSRLAMRVARGARIGERQVGEGSQLGHLQAIALYRDRSKRLPSGVSTNFPFNR